MSHQVVGKPAWGNYGGAEDLNLDAEDRVLIVPDMLAGTLLFRAM